jgi:hypothetical protein
MYGYSYDEGQGLYGTGLFGTGYRYHIWRPGAIWHSEDTSRGYLKFS